MEINLCQAVIKSGPNGLPDPESLRTGRDPDSSLSSVHTMCHSPQSEEKREKKKTVRWKEIANSAAKQSRRDVPARIHVPTGVI